jgi:N4-gp56 family major capsid protein
MGNETEITASHALTVRKWDDKAFRETIKKVFWRPYMGKDSTSIVQARENLTKSRGDRVEYSLTRALKAAGIEGEAQLEGNEEAMQFDDFASTLQEYAHAVRVKGTLSARRTIFDIKDEARPALTDWLSTKIDDKLFEAVASVGSVKYADATEAQKDAYLALNADRYLFGAATSNNSANDHSACLSNVDSTSDKMSCAIISLVRRLADLGSPKIKPIKMDNGRSWYVLVLHPYAARDLKRDSTWINAQQYAQNRGDDNPLFTGALGSWDSVIVVEHESVPVLAGVGASLIDVANNFLLGANSLIFEQGGYPERGNAQVAQVEKAFDYDRQWGCAIMSQFGHGKIVFNSKQHGVVTVFSSAVAD